MRPRLASPWRLAVVVVLASAALGPLFSDQLPRSADGQPHLLRMVALENAFRHGEWWPRFSPDLAYGYGYPLFHYYAPLVYYLGVGLHALGLAFIPALHLIFALALILGVGGVWALAEEWFGPSAAMAAAGVYLFAPYTLFNTFTRGAAPEALATALLPWLLWSLHHAVRQPTALALARLALLTAVLFLTHNLSSLVGAAFLIIWMGVELSASRLPKSHWAAQPADEPVPALGAGRLSVALTLIALLVGLALSAFFWLPAFLETGAVQVSQLTAPATLDFHNYFLTPAQLLTPSFTFDPRLEPPTIPVAFGLPQALLPVLALVLWKRYPNSPTRWRVAALAALLVGLLLLTSAVSQPVWEAIGPLRLVQFPWRFLGPATVVAALLSGAAVSALVPSTRSPAPRGPLLSAGLIGLTALLALPWTFVTHYPKAELPPNPSIETITDYEVESGGFGLTSTGEFLPVGVKQLPPEALQGKGAVNRLDVASLPPSVTVVRTDSQRLSAEAQVRANQPFEVVFQWFYFPGWQAEVDGRPAEVYASGPHGFVTVPVPAGGHAVHVYFGATPLREAAAGLSLLGAAGLAALFWLRRPSPASPAVDPQRPTFNPLVPIALGLILAGVRWWAEDCHNFFCRSRFDGQTVAGAAQAPDVNFGDRLNLIGFDPPAPVPADQALTFNLYWRLYGPVGEDYSVAAQLWDLEGHLVGQQDAWHPGGQPTHRWLAGGYAVDAHALTPYPGTPPGEYRLMVGVYPAGGVAVEVLDANGLPLGRLYEAARLALLPPARSPTDAELSPSQLVRAPFGPLELIGVDGLGGSASAGDSLPLVLYWRALQPPASNLQAQLELVSPDGTSTVLGRFSPAGDRYPTSAWPAGAGVRAPHTAVVPPDASAGATLVQLSLLDSSGTFAAGPVAIGALDVTVPARSFELPAIESPLNLRFGDGIELLGYQLATSSVRAGEAVALTLFWRSTAVVTTRYTAFVHLVNEQGALAAQVDSVPGQGARPTTGWLPSEVITDPYTLVLPADLPAGRYSLEVGLYDPDTAARLAVTDAAGRPVGDQAVLSTLDVTP